MSGFIQSGRFATGGGGGFDPVGVTGCVLWLDASDAATITESGGAVSSWADKSALGLDVMQSTSGAKPTTGTATINSLNALRFDAGDVLAFSGATGITVRPLTIFVVAKERSGGATGNGILSIHGNSGDDWNDARSFNISGGSAGGSVNIVRSLSIGGGNALAPGAAPTPTGIYMLVSAASLTALRGSDGTSGTASNAAAGSSANGGVVVGGRYLGGAVSGSYRFDGDIAEIVVYDTDLTTADKNLVGSYLETKWGTTWTDL